MFNNLPTLDLISWKYNMIVVLKLFIECGNKRFALFIVRLFTFSTVASGRRGSTFTQFYVNCTSRIS